MKPMKIRFYYTFGELIAGDDATPLYIRGYGENQPGIYALILDLLEGEPGDLPTDDPNSKALAIRVWDKLWNKFVIYVDKYFLPGEEVEKPELEDIKEEIKDFGMEVLDLFEGTKERYAKLLESYDSLKNALLNKLSSDTVTKFNDTPQLPNDYSSDSYLTNITQIHGSTDGGLTAMDRLKQIDDNYRNVLNAWAEEFVRTFLILGD